MSPAYKNTKPKARSPLGAYIGKFLSPKHDNGAIAAELFGAERAEQWIRALSRVRLRKKGGPLEAELHDTNDRHVGRFFAWLVLVLENIDPTYQKACTRQLYQGRTRQWDKAQQRAVYVPAPKAGGVAVRLGVSPREVQRYVRLAVKLGIVSRAQVKDHERVQQLPKHMRGKRWSFSILHWCGQVPRAVASHLSTWWGSRGRRKFHEPAPDAQQSPEGDPPAVPSSLRAAAPAAPAAAQQQALEPEDTEALIAGTLARLRAKLAPPNDAPT